MSALWPIALASFLAAFVEGVEALTIVLAVGAVRGWRWALLGTSAAVAALAAITILAGPALSLLPLSLVRLGVGTLLLLFGLRWLRKSVLRAAGIVALHDEAAAYAAETDAMRRTGGGNTGWDPVAFGACFQIAMLEGIEIVFVVIAMGAGGMLLPASLGAAAALAVVVLLGTLLHRPLTRVPENSLKFAVGAVITGFGTFWLGEGLGAHWPGGDWAAPALVLAFLAIAGAAIPLCRRGAVA
jgi:uncharacterized membrane protein